MGKYFGTDGIRGIANKDLSVDLALKIGKVLSSLFFNDESKNVVVIGSDTRQSKDMLKTAVIAGLCSGGIDVIDLGIIPTPAISYLTKYYGAQVGVVISASHNPWQYNGIKIFDKNGHKLSLDLEKQIEDLLEKEVVDIENGSERVGKVLEQEDYIGIYIEHLLACVENKIDNFKIAIDCANGSASVIVPLLFKKLGSCEYHILSHKPDGYNINLKSGSTDVEQLRKYVINNKFDCGIAYDGDADRCIMVDEIGNILDGDVLLALLSKLLLASDNLKNKTVVGTVMSNLGLKDFCDDNNLNFIEAKVGERYVLEEMVTGDYSLGGEESGHIILRDYSGSGDGELTSLKILEYMSICKKSLSDLSGIIKKYPKILINIPMNEKQKKEFYDNKDIQNEIEKVSDSLGNNGRLVIRVSGTEPLLRVMIEGKNITLIENIIKELVEFIKCHL